jgi:RNA polymerase sigma-70 factor (family 1)
MKLEQSHADDEIIVMLKNNDEQAMIVLYKLHWKKLYTSAYKILKDKETCQDIIQDVFIRIWHKRDQLNIGHSLETYIFASVRYEVYRKIRETKRYEPIVDEMADTIAASKGLDTLEYKELESHIESVIDTLPAKCKEVYRMSRNELLSHKEIAEKLAISTNAVRNHITKALHRLRISMQQLLMLLMFLLYR